VEEDCDPTAAGTLTVLDVDSGENHFQAVDPASLLGTYGSFTFDSNTGQWRYTLNDEADIDDCQVVHDTLTVKSADGTATRIIDVTITGEDEDDDEDSDSDLDAGLLTASTLSPGSSSMTSVEFGLETAETMRLGHSFHFNGAISGFSDSDITHLADAVSGDRMTGDAQNAGGVDGTRSITDQTQTAEFFGMGDYSVGNFSDTLDLKNGILGTGVVYDLVV
jgi:VCBS repeat-containing protein